MSAYADFLKGKIKLAPVSGFAIEDHDVNPILKPHQRDIVRWAVRGGRRAIFAAFGLGKSVMQIEALRIVAHKVDGRGLIILPLGVRQEFRRDGQMLGVDIKFIRRIEEAGPTGLYMTNYETVRDGKLDPNEFQAVSLDEASVLRSYGSKTYQSFLSLFSASRFRFVATATPSPNRYKELIHYAGFLGIMDTGQALTRFFQRDSTQANNLTIYPHKEREFWLWLNSWAIFLQRPSDLGHSDEGYDLPPFKVVYHEVRTDLADGGVDRDGQMNLIRDMAIGVVGASKEKRDTLDARVAKLNDIIAAAPSDHFILWHDLEDERRAIENAVPTAVSVYGSQDLEEREQAIVDFSDGKFQYLAAKPVIAGSGCNFQRHCHKAVFLGIGFKFNDFIQAIHRLHRFLQGRPVEIHIIYAESEREILRTLQAKWERHNQMVDNMSEIIRQHGLDQLSAADVLTRTIGVQRIEARGNGWLVANNDCVEEARSMADNSVDLIVTSIPFSNHYEYTPSYNDFGHTDSDDHFFGQMNFLTPELLRVLKPGRVYACHVKDRILFGNVTGLGMPTVNPFHAKTLFHCQAHGFAYMGMVQINTDVVRENNQTYRLGYTEMRKDGTKMGVGSPEYLLLFRKLPSDTSKAYADEKVSKTKDEYSLARWQVDAHSFWRSSGDRLLTPDELAAMGPDKLAKTFTDWSLRNVYDYETHIRIGEALEARGALPSSFMSLAPGATAPWTWHDVNRMRTLNGEQSRKGLEFHICPLQFDIVDRVISRFSAKGELVFDPFGGLFTVPYRALKLGRQSRAAELNPGYFLDAGPASVSGFTQVVASDAGLWKATYEEIPVRDAQGIGLVQLWRAIAVQAEGRLNPILISVHDIERKPFPIGLSDADLKGEVPHSDDALFDDGAGYVSSVIDVSLLSDATIRSTMLNVIKALSGDLEPGHRFSIGERLYQVRSVVAQDAVTATIKIWPPLREAWHAGSRLEFDRPVLRVRLASDKEMDLPLELGRWSFPTVNFIEDL